MAAPQGNNPSLSIFPELYDIGWPTTLGSGAFTGGTIAKTLQGAHPDAFLVRGGTLVRIPEAGQYDCFLQISTQVGDVTTVPGAGQQAGTDGIAFVGVGGVHVGAVSPVDGLLDVTAVDLSNTTGQQVRAADLDGDGQSEIVVLQNDGQTFEVYAVQASLWTSLGSFTLPGVSILDFDLARIDSQPGHELVLGLTDGTETYGLTLPGLVPSLQMSRRNPAFTENQVETVRNHVDDPVTGVRDGYAWAVRISSLNRWGLTAVTSNGNQGLNLLGASDEVLSIATGQLDDQDAREDLVVQLEQANQIHGFLNQDVGPLGLPFDNSVGAFESGTGFSGSTSEIYPVVGDVDGSGIDDLFLGHTPTVEVHVMYDFDTVDYSATSAFTSAGISWSWAASGFLGDWYFGDEASATNGGYGLIRSTMLSNAGMSGLETTLWMDPFESVNGANSQSQPFLADSIAHCPSTSLVSTETSGEYTVSLPVPIGNAPTGNPLNSTANHYVLEIQPPDTGSGLPQPLRMGLGMRTTTNSVAGGSGLLASPNLTIRSGLNASDLAGFFFTDANGSGVGVIVETVPIRRIKTPPGVPPQTPQTPCTIP